MEWLFVLLVYTMGILVAFKVVELLFKLFEQENNMSVTIEALRQQIKEEIDKLTEMEASLPKAQKKRRISTHKKKREHPPRYYLNEQYRGMTVSAATLLAAARMGDEAFNATDIGKKIYDYRGVERVSRMHSVIGSSLTSDPRCVRVERGKYMWDDGIRMAGTHDKKLEKLVNMKTDSPDQFSELVVE